MSIDGEVATVAELVAELELQCAISTQPPGSFGARMRSAFSLGAATADYVALFVSDAPAARWQRVHGILGAAASTGSAFIAPSPDGGYYAIGAPSDVNPAIFEDVSWSTAETFADSLRQLRKYCDSVFIAPSAADIDTWEDAVELLISGTLDEQGADFTAACVREIHREFHPNDA